MNNNNFVIHYVQACSSNQLPISDCGPVWQLGIIAVLLVMAVTSLLIMGFRRGPAQA